MNRLFALINVTGADAATFLQGQLTQDVGRLSAQPGLPAAWCNAQGRVIATLRLVAGDGGVGLVVPLTSAQEILERLARFRLRARVDLAPGSDDWRAVAISSDADVGMLEAAGIAPPQGRFAAGGGVLALDTGASPRCIEVYGETAALEAAGLAFRDVLDDAAWQRALITAGIPHVAGEMREKFTVHMLNLDLIGAVSFDKGCYSGQEVIARTEHRGRPKRRLLRYHLDSGGVSPGDALAFGGRTAGEVVNAVGADLLAVVPLEWYGRTLELDGHAAVPVPLPYTVPRPA